MNGFERCKVGLKVRIYMAKNEEHIAALHQKMRKLRRKRDLQGLYAGGAVCTSLAIILIALVRTMSGTVSGSEMILYTASSLLDESAGGYVVTALAAFSLGVVVSVAARKYVRHQASRKDQTDKDQQRAEKK